MEKKTWKIRAMQIAMALLCLVMLSMPLYVGLQKLALKHPSWNRGLIAAILCDAPKKNPVIRMKTERVDWARKYPFEKNETLVQKIVAKVGLRDSRALFMASFVLSKLNAKPTPAERLDIKVNDKLIGYYHMAEFGRRTEDNFGWGLMNPGTKVVSYRDGYYDFAYANTNMVSRAVAISQLNQFVKSEGAHFFYVQAPIKGSPIEDQNTLYIHDYANNNADQLLARLKTDEVDFLDLRKILGKGKSAKQYHQMFFKTDHHWLPQTAVEAARAIAEKMQNDYGIQVELSQLSLMKYDVKIKNNFFLGSSGKKLTLARTKPDDFPVLHPKEDTHFSLKWYGSREDQEGNFEIIYDCSAVGVRDYYHANPYSMYGYGDEPLYSFENLKLSHFKDQKVMIIKDSFTDTMGPFLGMGVKHLVVVDVRAFTGSVERLIQMEKPDVVFLMYTPSFEKEINWKTHRDKFDFR